MRYGNGIRLLAAMALSALLLAGAFFVVFGWSAGDKAQPAAGVEAVAEVQQAPSAADDADVTVQEPGQAAAADSAQAVGPGAGIPGGKINPKVESSLNELASTLAASGPVAAAEFAATHKLDVSGDNVKVVLESGAGAGAAVAAAGGSIQTSYGNLLQAVVPIEKLNDLSASGSVAYIRSPSRPTTFATTNEGVADIGANTWQSAGYNGSGTKVAIVDPGFAAYQQAVAAGDLPANVTAVSFRADGDITGGGQDHGTACAELVYDVAPGAQIYLVNFDSDVELGNAVDWLIGQNVKVVSASWGFFGSFRGDGQGAVDDIVEKANAAGIFWANAAGNNAQMHWSGSFADSDLDSWTEFSGSTEYNRMYAAAGDTIDVFLTWNDWPGSSQDFDLFLYREGGAVGSHVAISDNYQSGTQSPAEELHYTVPPGQSGYYWIKIQNYSGGGNAVFQMYTFPNTLQYQTAAGSLGGQPADSAYAMTTGAVPVGGTSIESFSSRGPTIDGRIKPDIVGPDRVSTYTFGHVGFAGTSAAAPQLAAAGALIKGANPAYAPAQIQSFLEARATDLGAAGKDNTFGSGKLKLGAVPDFSPPVVTSVLPTGNVYATSTTVTVDYTDAASGIDTSSVSVTMDGAPLTGCTATVTSVSCPVSELTAGSHVIGGSLSDNAGNSAAIGGSFVVVCAQPLLSLGSAQPFWASYADFLARELSVSYSICEGNGTGAYNLQVEGSLNTGNVIPLTPLPLSLGDIPGGAPACIPVTIKYLVPPGVTSFRSTTFITASDVCGTPYAFPGVYPGV